MVKNEDSKAGTKDGTMKEKNKTNEKPDNIQEHKANPENVPGHALHEGVDNEFKGSTITMQGVSGKKITGSVVVIKKAKPVVEQEPTAIPQAQAPEAEAAVTPAAPAQKTTDTSKGEEISAAKDHAAKVTDKAPSSADDSAHAKEKEKEVKTKAHADSDAGEGTEKAKPQLKEETQADHPKEAHHKAKEAPDTKEKEKPEVKSADVSADKTPKDSSETAAVSQGAETATADKVSDKTPDKAAETAVEPSAPITPATPRPAGSQGGNARPQGSQGGPGGQGGFVRPQGYQGNQANQGGFVRPQGGQGGSNNYTSPNNQGGSQGGNYGTRPAGTGYQGNNPRPYNERQSGGFVRPQGPGGPGQGQGYRPAGSGYQGGDRPAGGYNQGPRPGGSDRPYTPRPGGAGGPGQGQGYRPAGGPGQGPRPGGGGYNQGPRTGGGYQGSSQRGGFDNKRGEEDVKEKIPEQPRINFAQRVAYDKEKINNDRKDTRKENVKPVAVGKDKHNMLRGQTAALANEGVSQVLQNESLLDAIFVPTVKNKSKFRPSQRNNRRNQQSAPMVRAVLTNVTLPDSLTVKELSEALKKTTAEVIKKLIKFGIMATVNQELDFDTASIIAEEFKIVAQKAIVVTEEDILFDDTDDNDSDMVTRPPVVVVMGHVDHGKTSLLDKIRSASVVSGEAGGITQHIGAYTVKLKDRNITFLDTPGHEAFTTMRARGAQVTDIAILVVAADDGVMPQTIEAINHAKAAGVSVIVAINKIDKPGANIDKVKHELSDNGIIPEEWGGTNIMVPVSALTSEGIDELLEMVLLTADIMELKSNPKKQAKGTVIEAKLDKNKGPVATVLVQRGTLKIGDTVVAGSVIGRVRAMTDDKNASVRKAGPSIPVEILGLPEVPEAGEIFYAVHDEKVAKSLAEKRRIKQRDLQLRANSKMSLETLYTQMKAGEVKDLNLIVKADVQGSVEAVRQSFEKLNTENAEVRVRVIHGAVGTVTETDVRLAEVSNAIIIGFNVRPSANITEMATNLGVDMRMYRVIYQAIEEIQAAMKGMLSKKYKEVVLGHVEIRQVFKVSNVGTIGGAYVTDGKVIRSGDARLLRDGVIIHEGKLASLKRFKDDAKEVASGYECGISLDKFNDIKEGDIIETYEMQEIV